MIYSVKLSNFKQHKSYEANFEAGLNTITGENGFGKTTVLKAIMFSLFGVAAAGAKNHLTTWGETGMQVETTVLLPVGRVIITRGLTKAEIRLDGELLAAGQTAVTGFVENQLGMNAKLFKNMLYAEQGETQALLKMGAAGLQRQLEVIANIEVIDKVITQIGTDNSRAEGELQGIREVGDINGLHDQLEALERVILNDTKAQASAAVQVKEAEDCYQYWRNNYKSAVSDALAHSRAQAELSAQQARVELLSEQLEQLQARAPLEVDKHHLEQLCNDIRQRDAELRVDTQTLNTFLNEQSRYFHLADKIAQLSQSIPVITQAKQLEDTRRLDKEAAIEAKSDMLNRQEALQHVNCRACHRLLEGVDMDRLKAEADQSVANYASWKGIEETSALALAIYLQEKGTTLASLQTAAADLAAAEREIAPLVDPPVPKVCSDQLGMNRIILDALKIESATLQTDARAYESWSEQKRGIQAQSTEASKAITPLQEQMAKIKNYTEQELASVKNSQIYAHAALQEQTEIARTLEGQLRDTNRDRGSLLAAIKLAETRADKVQILQHQSALRSDLQKYLRTNRAKFLEDSWVSLTHYASHLIAATTEGLMTTLSRSDSGDFTIIENGQLVPIEELSGARKSIVGLCLRLSLAHLFYGSGGFVLLDEVTADCSEGNAARIAGMLRGLPSQVIMVTHRQGDAVNANHSILID